MELPIYSQSLIELVRAYDRAALAVRTSSWNYASLKDEAYYKSGDGSLPDWASIRLNLLANQLKPMNDVIHKMIIAESTPLIACVEREDKTLALPIEIKNLFDEYNRPEFCYNQQSRVSKAKIKEYTDKNYYVLLFEGDGYILPRNIPSEIIEIWWRRQFYDMFNNCDYTMVLIQNPEYGWDCYGHEL